MISIVSVLRIAPPFTLGAEVVEPVRRQPNPRGGSARHADGAPNPRGGSVDHIAGRPNPRGGSVERY